MNEYKYGNIVSNYPLTDKQLEYLNRKGPSYCINCLTPMVDVWYTYCSVACHDLYVWNHEKDKQVGAYDIDKEVYTQWLTDKIATIESMTTREEIENRILEIAKIEFYAKREWAILHQQLDKITGRKGISPLMKAERDKLITDPNIKVNWEGEPRPKKAKGPKKDNLKDLLGIDLSELTANIKKQKAEAANGSEESKTEKPKAPKTESIGDLISMLASSQPKKVEEPKLSDEEVKAKSDALRERMRNRNKS